MVMCGLDLLLSELPERLKGAKWGLLCNQASVNHELEQAPEAIAAKYPGSLTTLFSPQHGYFSEKQDNMVESGHGVHPRLKLPIYSLYGDARRPDPQMFSGIDVLLVDLWDLGCRVYTFFTTVVACMEVAAKAGVAVAILDRPNPLGRGEEGPILPPGLMSFVGPHEMPLRHGLSLGELCCLVAAENRMDLELFVLSARGWQGEEFSRTGITWVSPSPNMPFLDTARVYPGQVLLEGVSLSEGRGTTRPFEIWGAPGLDPWQVAEKVEPKALDGCTLRPYFFEPTFHKYAGQTCGGFMIHVTRPEALRPVRMTLALLSAVARTHPGLWELREPPYEYEHERRPLDLLLGDATAVDRLVKGAFARDLEETWQKGLAQWRERCIPYLIYPE